jgi:hypothetical protein
MELPHRFQIIFEKWSGTAFEETWIPRRGRRFITDQKATSANHAPKEDIRRKFR